MKRFFTFIMTFLIVLIFTASAMAESPKKQMHRVFGDALKTNYADTSLRPGVSALCQYVTRYQTPYMSDTTKLDYDLEERHREVWEKIFNILTMYAQMYATSNEEEHTVANIFVEECKDHVGFFTTLTPTRAPKWIDMAEYEENIRRDRARNSQ